MRNIILVLTAILLVGMLAACTAPVPAEPETPAAAEQAAQEQSMTEEPAAESDAAAPSFANFSTLDMNGNAVDQSIFQDHDLTMVNVWATYCGYCIDEMPDLADLNNNYSEGFQVIGIITDIQNRDGSVNPDGLALANQIMENTGVTYLSILPSQELNDSFLSTISGVPTTIFIDREGNQVGKAYAGARSREEWVMIIDSLMADLPTPEKSAAADTDAADAAKLYDMEYPFYSFQTTDLNGSEMTDALISERDFAVALMWDPTDAGSEAALQAALQFQADNDWVQVIGIVVNAGDGSAAKAMSEKNATGIPQLLPTEDMLKMLEAGKVMILTPWGDLAGEYFDASESLARWQQALDDAEGTVYGEGCCG